MTAVSISTAKWFCSIRLKCEFQGSCSSNQNPAKCFMLEVKFRSFFIYGILVIFSSGFFVRDVLHVSVESFWYKM